jgi:hypothetical protein
MARQLILLTTAAGALVLTVFAGLAQEPENPPPVQPPGDMQEPPPGPPGSQHDFNKRNRPERPEFNAPRKFLERLSPEEKEQFKQNLQRWREMPQSERQMMLDREKMRHERMQKEVDEAIRSSGLQLDKDQREVYMLRYTQERRKIEEQLRREMEEKRKPLLMEMVGRLKMEFSTPKPPAPH